METTPTVASRRLRMRCEERVTEHRTPIVPDDARRLVELGVELTVEESAHRAFPIEEYAVAGCRVAPAGGWVDAPPDTVVIGLKELPPAPELLRHRHVYFGHAYKGQDGAGDLLRRFAAGGGALLDIEYLVDDDGRRLAAFGYWAGYVGAALALLHHRGSLAVPLRPTSRSSLDGELRNASGGERPRVLVIGALGRSGRGARDALAAAGIAPTAWDIDETRQLDRRALLDHDILVNTVLTAGPAPPFVRPADLDAPRRRLAVVSDVTCDVASAWNLLPIYDRLTSWQRPVRRVRHGDRPFDVIAIDNLPSVMPKEASMAFSAELLPHLASLGAPVTPWRHCLRAFHEACRAAGLGADAPLGGALADV